MGCTGLKSAFLWCTQAHSHEDIIILLKEQCHRFEQKMLGSAQKFKLLLKLDAQGE